MLSSNQSLAESLQSFEIVIHQDLINRKITITATLGVQAPIVFTPLALFQNQALLSQFPLEVSTKISFFAGIEYAESILYR